MYRLTAGNPEGLAVHLVRIATWKSGTLRVIGQCLALRLRGEGNELKVDWSVRVNKYWENEGATRSSARLEGVGGKKEEVVLTKKKTDDPTFDWVEFARRNGIDVPAQAVSFFPRQRDN